MVLFKVPVEEKIPEAPKPAKKPEVAVVPPKEEPTKKEKALKPKPKLVPEEVPEPRKVFEHVVVSETEPEKIPERQEVHVKEKTPERVPEKVLAPERKAEEIPKMVPEKVPERVPEKPPEKKMPEKAPPERKPVKVPQKVAEEEKIPEKKPPEEVKPERVPKKQTERISVEKTPEKVPEAKPKREVEEILPKATSLVKIERRKGAEKIQEVYYVTEKVSPTEEVWEHEEVVEEHAEVLYEDEVARLGEKIVSLSEVDILSTTEKARDKKSELRGEISVTDSSKRKETRVTKHRVPKTEETIVVVQEPESDRDREVITLKGKPTKIEEEYFIKTIESPKEEIADERKDSLSVRQRPDERDISKQETTVTVKKGREITITTESKERQVRPQTYTVKETESVQEKITSVTDTDKTKPVIISTEARKLTKKLDIEEKPFREVTYEELVDRDVEIIADIPEEEYSRSEEITEIRIQQRDVPVKDKRTKVIPTEVKVVDEKTSRKEEPRIKPAVITDSKKDETVAPGKVPAKKQEIAEQKQEKKLKPDEIIDTKEKVTEKTKLKEEVTPKVKPKESVTDIEPKKPKVTEQEIEFEPVAARTEADYKKKEEPKDVRPQRVEKTKEEPSLLIKDTVETKPSVPSKPEKKRISPVTASRAATKGLLKAEKRAAAQTDYITEKAEKVFEREEVAAKPQIYQNIIKDEEEVVGESSKSLLQEGILSKMEEPEEGSEISDDLSVTDGLKTRGLKTRVIPKTKEKVIMTGSKSRREKVGAVQGEPANRKLLSVQKADSPTVSVEIKDNEEYKEAFQSREKKSESPEISVKAVSDQKQVIEPQQVSSEADAEEKEGLITQGLKDIRKIPVRKFESSQRTDGQPLEQATLQKKSKQTDQEEKPLEAENFETISKTQKTDSSGPLKPIEKESSKPRIVESEEAEEKSAGQKRLAKTPGRVERDSQSKERELAETNIEEIQTAVSKDIQKKEMQKGKADSLKKKTLKKPEIQELTKDVTDTELLEEDTPEKCIITDEDIAEGEGPTNKLQRPEEVSKKKLRLSKQKGPAVVKTGDVELDLRAVTEVDQDMKQEGKELTKEKSTRELVPESILSKVVKVKDKLVKVSPMEGTTEVRPNIETSVSSEIEVKHPESLSEKETITENALKKPEILPKSKTLKKDVSQKVRRQTAVEDEDQFKTPVVQVSPKEKTKPSQEQAEKQLEPDRVPKQTVECHTPEQDTTEAEHIIYPTEKIKTRQEETKRKASAAPVVEKMFIKSVTEQDAPERKVPAKDKESLFPQTEETAVEDQLKPDMNKVKTLQTEKGKDAVLLETSQIDEVPLNSDDIEDVQSEVREDQIDKVTDKFIPTEEQETKMKKVLRKPLTEEKEKPEAIPQKQRQQKPIRDKADNVQAKIVRFKDVTKAEEVTEQELIAKMPLVTPVIELKHKEETIAPEKCSKTAVVKDTVRKEEIKLRVIPAKVKPTERPQKVQLETDEATDDLMKQMKPARKEVGRKGLDTAVIDKTIEINSTGSKSVSPLEPQQKPQAIVVEQDQLKVSTVKDKTFKISPLKETKTTDEEIERKVLVTPSMEETSKPAPEFTAGDEEMNSFGEIPCETLIYPKEKGQKLAKTKEVENKQIPSKSIKKFEKLTSVKDGTPEKQAETKEFVTEHAFDGETDTTESESVSPQAPQQKPQEIIVEQDQPKVSTVKDKTFKVTPLKEAKITDEEIERKVIVTPLMEETSKELEVEAAPEKLGEIRKTEFEADVEEIDNFGIIPSETSVSMKEKRPKLAKTKEVADKQIPSKSIKVKDKPQKVTPIKDSTPEKHTKIKEAVMEHAMSDEETDITEGKPVSPQEPQQKLQEILVEQNQLKVSTVKHKTFKVSPPKEKKTTHEHIERKVSVTPLIEGTSKELEVEAAPEKLAAVCEEIHEADSIPSEESISLKEKRQKLTKIKDVADEQIPSKSVTVTDKTEKVISIKDGTPDKQTKTKVKVTECVFDEGIDLTERVSVSPQEPQQKPTKPQEIIVEQNQLKVSTVKHKTFKVSPFKERKTTDEEIERKAFVTPLIEETFREPKVEAAPEKLGEIREIEFAVVDEEIDSFGKIPSEISVSMKKREQKLVKTKEVADKQIPSKSIKGKDKPQQVIPIKAGIPEKYTKTEGIVMERAMSDEETDTTESESVSPLQPQQKPQKIIVGQDQLKVITIKHKTFKVSPLKEAKTTDEEIERKGLVSPMMEETSKDIEAEAAPEKLADIRETELTAVDKEIHVADGIPPEESISQKERRQKLAKTKEVEDKQIPSEFVTVKDKLKKVTPIENDTPEKHTKTKEKVTERVFDEETDTTECESVFPQEPQRKAQKTLVEQDQLKLSTVKHKTFKVTPLKGAKTTDEQIERKAAVTPLIEEALKELEVETSPEKLADIRETEFAAVDEEIHVADGIPSKESTSPKDKRQKLVKTKEAGDKQIPSEFVSVKDKLQKVTPIKDGIPEKHTKTKEKVTELVFDEEIDITENKLAFKQTPHQKPQEDTVEQDQLKVRTVKDKTFKVTPSKEAKPRHEQIERKVSVTPMMEETLKDIEAEAAPEKLADIRETELTAVDKEIHVADGIPPEESMSQKERRQKWYT
ncbi:uncharacterized protein LOC144466895 [Epinephelus lanceolatus]